MAAFHDHDVGRATKVQCGWLCQYFGSKGAHEAPAFQPMHCSVSLSAFGATQPGEVFDDNYYTNSHDFGFFDSACLELYGDL